MKMGRDEGMFQGTEVPYDRPLPDVGEKGTAEIRRIRNRLYPGDPLTTWKCRRAPSIITRCEAQLFNFSMPRFALRVYLDSARKSFVNARRLEVFSAQARRWAPRRRGATHLQNVDEESLKKPPGLQFIDKTPVADSLLQVPAKYDRESYHVLSAELGRAYGEGWPVRGSPYAKHIRLAGGGLCAQAVCFMATALLHDHCTGIYGIGEITALVMPEEVDELLLKGLTHQQIVSYFRDGRVGLWASRQHVLHRYPEEWASRFATALRAYLLSDMPVVLPLDAGRMAGKVPPDIPLRSAPIYATNGVPAEAGGRSGPQKHAVLVVGCSRRDDTFLLHDPSTFPFLEASAAQLLDAGLYDPALRSVTGGIMIPVTPAGVRTPLYDGRIPAMDILRPEGESPSQRGGLDRFRLTELGKAARAEHIAPGAADVVARAVLSLGQCGIGPRHWCWLSAEPSCIELWDAAADPDPQRGGAARRPMWRAWRQGEEWRETLDRAAIASCPRPKEHVGSSGPEEATGGDAPGGQELSVGVISSFAVTGGIDQVVAAWGEFGSDLLCEYYAFMQDDAEALVPHVPFWEPLWNAWLRWCWAIPGDLRRWLSDRHGRPRPVPGESGVAAPRKCVPAVDRLAAASTRPLAISRVAGIINGKLEGKGEAGGIRLTGLATFLPEITGRDASGRRARRALKGIVRLAGALRRKGHPLRTVEMVSGSLVDGILPCKTGEPGQLLFVAQRLSREEGTMRLLKALGSVAKAARRAGIVLSVELEPGPFAVLNAWQPLVDFCRAVSDRPKLHGVVGLNLDVAHWRLAGIEPRMLAHPPAELAQEAKMLREMVAHAHISDHGRGHMADAAVCSLRSCGEVSAWLELLAKLPREPSNSASAGYGGVVSVEMEACMDLGMIKDSVLNIRRIMRKLRGTTA